MRKKWLVFFLLFITSILSLAHEFWIEPDRFYFAPGENARLQFRLGDDFIGSPVAIKPEDIQQFKHYVGDQSSDVRSGIKDEAFEVRLTGDGAHLLVMETKRRSAKMDGANFTAYLRQEGLDEIFYQREKTRTSGDSASEYYSRYSKLILQAGSRLDDTYKKVCNLPIEIIPDKNPAAMKKGDPIKFKIIYQGKPLFGAKVKVWNRYNHQTTVQNIYSQQDGMIETHVSNPGMWMVSVVNMVPSKDPHAQYRTFWGTLVFAVR